MKTRAEWLATNYPRAVDAPLGDYMRLAYLEYAVSELISEVEALKPLQKTNDQLVSLTREIVPMLGTFWVEDYERYNVWREKANKILSSLEPDEPIELIAPDTFPPVAKFPRISTDICRCGENKDHDLVCPDCGGYLF